MTTPDHRGHGGADVTSGGSGASNLTLRIASAAVLAPIVLAITYVGGWPFSSFAFLRAVGIFWEWTRSSPARLAPAISLRGWRRCSRLWPSPASIIPGRERLVSRSGLVCGRSDRGQGDAGRGGFGPRSGWSMPASRFLARRAPPATRYWGLTALWFLFATVWTTDIFAFLGGRAIGGPLLWPQVSPNKTWVGRDRRAGRGGCRRRRGRLCERYRQAGDGWGHGVAAFSPGPGRRPVRVRGQAAFWRQRREPAHPRPWGIDGSARRLPGCRVRRPPHRHRPAGNRCAGARACWYGRADEAEASRWPRVELAPVPRTVTLLGATGSIGSSTVDLLRQDPGRYRVEAVTAHRNAAALARLARELGARFAAVADPAAYGELKVGAFRHRHRSRAPAPRQSSRPRNGRPIGSWRRSPAQRASSRRSPLPSAAPRWRSPTRNVWSAPARCSCGGRPPPAPRFCRSIPSTMRSFRRWAPAGARTCGASC